MALVRKAYMASHAFALASSWYETPGTSLAKVGSEKIQGLRETFARLFFRNQLIMLFDAAESVLFVLFGHFDEVAQSFLEFLRPVSRPFDEPDSDALVSI